ncbi:MAG: hypothetical protein JSS72_09520 [Armatimonadetes bacterium]|nr:hypothetical protein [Armatimonadota bacterium]
MFLTADPPGSWLAPLIINTLISLVGLYLYNKARVVELAIGRKPAWHWLWILPMVLAFYLGVNWLYNLTDPIYRSMLVYNAKKLYFSHFVAWAIPVAGTGVIALMNRTHKIRLQEMDY